nr:SDR family NAD(P)-dependent oxidoreductase [Rhodococcus sp. WB9]
MHSFGSESVRSRRCRGPDRRIGFGERAQPGIAHDRRVRRCPYPVQQRGVDSGALFSDIPLRTWQWVMDVNFYGVLHGCREFLPLLRQQPEAHIVNTCSVAAFATGAPTMSPYVASQFAVLGMSEKLEIELRTAGESIGVSVLCPGPVKTRMTESERNRPSGVVSTLADPVRPGTVPRSRDGCRRDPNQSLLHPAPSRHGVEGSGATYRVDGGWYSARRARSGHVKTPHIVRDAWPTHFARRAALYGPGRGTSIRRDPRRWFGNDLLRRATGIGQPQLVLLTRQYTRLICSTGCLHNTGSWTGPQYSSTV